MKNRCHKLLNALRDLSQRPEFELNILTSRKTNNNDITVNKNSTIPCVTVSKWRKSRTPSRNAVPLLRQSSANILVAFRASSMLSPEATTAHTMAPADEPASGVVS